MNLPLITAKIGRDFKSDDIFESVYKEAKTNDKKEYSDVFLTFDLEYGVIEFDQPIAHRERHSKEFNYFGNNSARASQINLVREAGSLKYLLFKVWNDLYKNIRNEDYDELESIFRLLVEEKFLSINGEHCEINLLKFKFPIDDVEKILEDSKKVILKNSNDAEIYNEGPSKFIKDCLGISSKEEISLVIPRVRTKDGEEIILSQHSNYLKLIKRINKLEVKIETSKSASNKRKNYCYICGKPKNDVSAEYTKQLSRTGINKIFITENSNSSYEFDKNRQTQSYSMCGQCFNDLKSGEKKIQEEYEMQLARERTFILPEGYLQDFDYTNFLKLKKQIDAVFHPKEFEKFSTHVEEEADLIGQNNYSINFVVYRTDGNSVTILQTIEDINNKNFSEILKIFKKNNEKQERLIENNALNFGFHSVYRMIPVKTSKDGTQQNIKRVLSLYSALFKLETVKTKVLFEYACEALEKGVSQLRSSKIRNYQNLGISPKTQIDYFIKKIIMSYIALIQSLQDLHMTEKKVFNKHTERGEIMAENEKVYLTDETEIFLRENGFSKGAKSLFYLGCLLGKVGSAQYMKKHKSKPILNKIIFQGMNRRDILRLYNELVEKLRQYRIVNYSNELLMQKFHENFGAVEKDWQLSDHENIFYLMSGYSFLVGKKSGIDDQTDEESEEKGE